MIYSFIWTIRDLKLEQAIEETQKPKSFIWTIRDLKSGRGQSGNVYLAEFYLNNKGFKERRIYSK